MYCPPNPYCTKWLSTKNYSFRPSHNGKHTSDIGCRLRLYGCRYTLSTACICIHVWYLIGYCIHQLVWQVSRLGNGFRVFRNQSYRPRTILLPQVVFTSVFATSRFTLILKSFGPKNHFFPSCFTPECFFKGLPRS